MDSYNSRSRDSSQTLQYTPDYYNTSPTYSTSAQQTLTNSSVRRKPLGSDALSPTLPAARFDDSAISNSIRGSAALTFVTDEPEPYAVRDLDRFPRGYGPTANQDGAVSRSSVRDQLQENVPPQNTMLNGLKNANHNRIISEPSLSKIAANMGKSKRTRSETVALRPTGKPQLLDMNPVQVSPSDTLRASKKPQTPKSKRSSFFNWKRNPSPEPDSSSTELSDTGRSPLPSPNATSPHTSAYSSRSHPLTVDARKQVATENYGESFGGVIAQSHTSGSDSSERIGELEGELREISYELAGSIRREIELEDMVEALQDEARQGLKADDRTSDYFSDSGISFSRYTGGETSFKPEDIAKVKREAEQERAQLKVGLSQKWQDECTRRKALESHIHLLEEQILHYRQGQAGVASISIRANELQAALDNAQRHLYEERLIKENFEDLLRAMREDMEQQRNERDNLRDEVIPQLRAQIEGLELSASESQNLQYDFARMEQEIQVLKNENMILVASRKSQLEMQQQGIRFDSVAQDEEELPTSRDSMTPRNQVSLGRSTTVAVSRLASRPDGTSRARSPSRSNTVGGSKPASESREWLAERMKDVEFQRDALHSAMRLLLLRQDYSSRGYEKRIKLLETELDSALQNGSPRKLRYENEVEGLRDKVNHLRQRADDAIQQKWQCEKGLGGLKMDLDRSEQETSSLRNLLKDDVIAVPEELSSSLEQAYAQLEHDRKQIEALIADPKSRRTFEDEKSIADQLETSAERSEALASQVRNQLQTNSGLRGRVADAVTKGERNQQDSARQINVLQRKLRQLEETVSVAQQHSESAVMKHEEEVRVLQENHHAQLLRVKTGRRTSTSFRPTTSPSQMFSSGGKSPRLDHTTTGPAITLNHVLKTEYLERQVEELEQAVADADSEMEQVVGRMNQAQVEVAELQSERDEALRHTSRLQAEIMREREKVLYTISNRVQ